MTATRDATSCPSLTESLDEHVRVCFRPIRPADKERLERGFARLSPRSRFRRFMAHKKWLTPEELRFFTEVDGVDHYALGAFELDAAGDEGDAVGVARFVRLRNEPEVAEMAIAVVDDRQRMGLGRRLLELLLGAASERGVRRIRCYVLAENEQMLALLRHAFHETAFRREGALLTGDFPVPGEVPAEAREARTEAAGIFDLLRLAAEGAVTLPFVYGLTTFRQMLAHFRSRPAAEPAGEAPSAPERAPVDGE